MPPHRVVPKLALAQVGLALALCSSCKTTLHSIGCGENGYTVNGGTALGPLHAPGLYPDAFRDVLGKSDADITAKIATTFNQLFHGDPSSEAIYFTTGTDQAYILDVLHGDVRSEGIGLGMMIAVELGKRDEFDRLLRDFPQSTHREEAEFERVNPLPGAPDPNAPVDVQKMIAAANDPPRA